MGLIKAVAVAVAARERQQLKESTTGSVHGEQLSAWGKAAAAVVGSRVSIGRYSTATRTLRWQRIQRFAGEGGPPCRA